MKLKTALTVILFVMCLATVSAQSYMPDEGIFAYKYVENYTLNGFNFTMLSDYDLIFQNETHMNFTGDNNTLNISVVDNGKIEKINSTKNISSSNTMLGSLEGYLVDSNGSYTFSFKQNSTLISVSSKDMTLMMGVIGRD